MIKASLQGKKLRVVVIAVGAFLSAAGRGPKSKAPNACTSPRMYKALNPAIHNHILSQISIA